MDKNRIQLNRLATPWDVRSEKLQSETFLVKFIHDWLPVGKLLQHYKTHYSSKCPSCDCEIEDRNHFLQCHARSNWHKDMISDVRKYFTKHPTRPALADILYARL